MSPLQTRKATMLSSSFQNSEEDFIESLESLREASASLDLHESQSCSLLLPCGLLPEELAELEASALASTLQGECRWGRSALNCTSAAGGATDAPKASPCPPPLAVPPRLSRLHHWQLH